MKTLSAKAQFKAATSARRLALRNAHLVGRDEHSKVWSRSILTVNGVRMNFNLFSAPDCVRCISLKVFFHLESKLSTKAERRELWNTYNPETKFN